MNIKNVKLARDYVDDQIFICKGIPGKMYTPDIYLFYSSINHKKEFTKEQIINCKTGLFEIEFEITKNILYLKIEYNNLESIKKGWVDINEYIIKEINRVFRNEFEIKIDVLKHVKN